MRVRLGEVWVDSRSKGLTSRLLLGGFRVDFEWVWVGLELNCVRCADGLAAALGLL